MKAPITNEPVLGDNDHQWNIRVCDKPHNPIPAFYSRELNKIISKMLEKEMDDRPSAMELLDDVLELIASRQRIACGTGGQNLSQQARQNANRTD